MQSQHALSLTAIGGDSYAEPVSDSYLVGVTFPAPDRVGDSNESLFFHGAVAVIFVCNCRRAWFSLYRLQLISSAFKLLPGRLPAGTGKFEFQRTVPTISRVNRGRSARDACHLHPSLRLWMEYSLADLDNQKEKTMTSRLLTTIASLCLCFSAVSV